MLWFEVAGVDVLEPFFLCPPAPGCGWPWRRGCGPPD